MAANKSIIRMIQSAKKKTEEKKKGSSSTSSGSSGSKNLAPFNNLASGLGNGGASSLLNSLVPSKLPSIGSSNSGSSGGTNKNNQYTGSSMGVTTHNDIQQSWKNQMNANSIAWWSADEAERKRLEQENRNIAALLGEGVTFDPGSGTWSGVADGSAVDEMKNWNNNYIQQNPQPTQPTRDPRIDELLNQILNRDKFSYDVENDPLYQQYAQMYQREGDRAMRDTLSEVAASAGGMNSYAITAAQQANNYYNSQLADKVPELFQLAYSMYLNDIEQDVQNMGILQDMDATQYNRYRDTMNDWYNDKNFAYNVYQDAVEQGNWQRTFDNNNFWANKEFDYNDMWRNKEYTDNRADIEYNRDQYDKESAQEEVWRLIEMGIDPTSIDPSLVSRAEMNEEIIRLALAAVKPQEEVQTSKGKSSYKRSNPDDDIDDDVDITEDSSKVGNVQNGAPLVSTGFSTGATFEAEVDNIYKSQGKDIALEALREAMVTGVISMDDYMKLMNKYSS